MSDKPTSKGLLQSINSPDDLKKISEKKLAQVADELRSFIIDSVSKYGGHFASSLGVIELTVALHYVFNTPYDKLIWDVGHQAYGHKVLTGRKEIFSTNRKFGGISGFPKMSESPYDSFGTGHSSTSISAALGMAKAAEHQNITDRQHVAIIGDGALTGGMAFEALNHVGISGTNLLIILNDNRMSIDPNVGALKDYLTDIVTSKTFNKIRSDISSTLSKLSKIGKTAKNLAYKLENTLKSFVSEHSNLFQSFNIRYFGPVDGHDVNHLTRVLKDLKRIKGPKILHVVTVKGKGFGKAEKNQTLWHAPGTFDKKTGEIITESNSNISPPKYQDVFGQTLVELAKQNEKIMVVTPAMISGSGLKVFEKEMKHRLFDVDIAEQHAVTFSAGLATQGLRPFCNIYSTFMQRGYDQVIHDVCLQNLPVVFCLDRAGLVGADGPTHHGAYDMAYMRCIPNLIISSPINEIELRNLLYTAQLDSIQTPFLIRYPRGRGVTEKWQQKYEEIKIGTGKELANGKKIAILSVGPIGNEAIKTVKSLADEGINIGHYDMRFVKPLDKTILKKVLKQYKAIITVEDGSIIGGFGSAVLEQLNLMGEKMKIKTLGIPDMFIEHGPQITLYDKYQYNEKAIYRECKNLLRNL